VQVALQPGAFLGAGDQEPLGGVLQRGRQQGAVHGKSGLRGHSPQQLEVASGKTTASGRGAAEGPGRTGAARSVVLLT
jgi:hypothetical protein